MLQVKFFYSFQPFLDFLTDSDDWDSPGIKFRYYLYIFIYKKMKIPFLHEINKKHFIFFQNFNTGSSDSF